MRMTRISYRRASPENWEKTIKRMVSLNKVKLEPADARNILKYLSDHNGLAPEEVRPIAFEAERRLVEYTYTADKDTSDTCSSLPHDRARDERAANQGGVGAAGRHAPRLLPARRQPADERRPGLPPDAGRCRPSRARTAGRPTTVIRWRRRSSTSPRPIPLDTPDMVGVVGVDAAARSSPAAGRSRAIRRARAPIVGQVVDLRRSERPRQLQHRDALHHGAHRRNRHARGEGDRLHRLPVARPRRPARAATTSGAK